MRRKHVWSIKALLLLGILGMSCGISHGAAEKVYNGHWWLSISTDQQYGFLSGYWDCYAYDYHGPANYSLATTEGMMQHLATFYHANPSKLGTLVPEVMYRFRAPRGARPPSGGEVHKGPHDGNDGQAWGVLGDDGELGYVEGYLWCWKHCLHNKGATFSKWPSEYVALISKWYGLNPKTGINADREPAKIADVLYKFRDRKQTPQTSEK